MRPLPTHFTDSHFIYDQILRQGMVALYTQTHKESGAIRYEVIRIREAPAVSILGKMIEEREVYPATRQWGLLGWTCLTMEEAQGIYGRLLEQ